jgi:hypothetical protein
MVFFLMKLTRAQTSLGMMFVGSLFVVAACTFSGKTHRRTCLPPAINVEYRHGAKILTQRLNKNGVHYSLSNLKFKPELLVKDKAQSGHWFVIGSSGSCKLSGPPPQNLVLDLTHEIVNRKSWQFPSPAPTILGSQNASFYLVILADGYSIELPRHYQGELKKDNKSDKFYETITTKISREDFIRIANSRVVTVQFASAATFDFDYETLAALKDFAMTLSCTN